MYNKIKMSNRVKTPCVCSGLHFLMNPFIPKYTYSYNMIFYETVFINTEYTNALEFLSQDLFKCMSI